MKSASFQKNRSESGSILVYFVFALVIASAIASVSYLSLTTINIAHRRTDMICATQLAEGGAALACREMEMAYTNRTAKFRNNLLANAAGAYALNSGLSSEHMKVYERTITAPFGGGQSVTAQIWFTNSTASAAAKVVGIATVGKVTQTATVRLTMQFGYGAAIISDAIGTTATGVSKTVAKAGNVVIDGNKLGPTVIDGGEGWAILANGRANIDTAYATVPASSISMTNYGTEDQLPDYTLEGSADQLFDFKRFIAVADLTPGGPSKSKNNHFASLPEFKASLKTNTPARPYEGVIVVDVARADIVEIQPADAPNGINVRGTLVFNFATNVVGADYLKNSATVNINPANLAGLNPTNPATYTTGYPPVYADATKNPVNIDITSKGFENFVAEDDLPAMMYSIGVYDIHGNANICGVLYTPSFVEIEQKISSGGATQYIRGSIIGGAGVLIENLQKSRTVISYDSKAIDLLATSGNKGKRVSPIFWE